MNIKKIFAGIIAVCVVGGVMPSVAVIKENNAITASAVNYKDGTYEQLEYRKYEDYVEIIGCDKSATEVVIPAEIDGVPVTSIKAKLFRKCEVLSSITIPDSITSVGEDAFSNTPWFESKQAENPLVIVNNLLIDGKNCSGDIVIPDGVKYITGCAFCECSDLTSVTIPDSVISIDYSVFLYCENLTDVIIPETLTDIHGCAFDKTPWLENKRAENPLVIVNDVVIDGKTCSGDVIIPDNVKIISDGAFYNCSGMMSAEIPNGVTKIGDDTFSSCTGLTSIKIPDSVTSIGYNAFSGCTGLTSVKIPDSVKSIGNGAFLKCENLTSVEIPSGVTSIGNGAFFDCSGLTSIKILNPDCDIYDYAHTISNGYNENDELYFNGTIYGHENSTAQAYAEKYDYKFELLGGVTAEEQVLGDIDGDGKADATDASFILVEYAVLSTSGEGTFTEDMKKYADINKDGKVDSIDSSLILSYYAYTSTGGTDTIDKYLEL